MAINKVDYFGKNLIDLTKDTVTAEKLLKGITAHDKAGRAITGTASGSKLEQEKEITISENGDYPITPDVGKVLSKVLAKVNVPTGGGGGGNKIQITKHVAAVDTEDINFVFSKKVYGNKAPRYIIVGTLNAKENSLQKNFMCTFVMITDQDLTINEDYQGFKSTQNVYEYNTGTNCIKSPIFWENRFLTFYPAYLPDHSDFDYKIKLVYLTGNSRLKAGVEYTCFMIWD